MEIIYDGRGMGKTIKLLEMANNYNGYIVSNNPLDLAKMAKSKNYTINFPLSYDEFVTKKYYAKGVKRIYIDNVDLLLEYMSSVQISAITLTNINV